MGDTLLIRGHHVGDNDRKATIVEVHGVDGAPPYVVRWEDGHLSVFVPSCDTVIERLRGSHTV